MPSVFRGVESLEMEEIGGALQRASFFPGLDGLEHCLGAQGRAMLVSQPQSTVQGSLSKTCP